MAVITLSREMGSRGDDVAALVATRLGVRLVGRELLNRAARAAGAPEVALAEIDELGLLGVRPSPAALRLYAEKVAGVIRELADEGNVMLIGRGGQVVLAGRPDVLHLRVTASRASRVAVVAERCGISQVAATARVDASDRIRSTYLRRQHGVRWDDDSLYDLVLNLDRLDVSIAADLVCLAAVALTQTASTITRATDA